MRELTVHTIIVWLMALAALSLSACGSDSHYDVADAPADGLTGSGGSVLTMRVSTIGQTRSGGAAAVENMHSLRIVVLHEDGTVEHNICPDIADDATTAYVRMMVTPGETKRVYLIANEAGATTIYGSGSDGSGLTALLDAMTAGTPGFDALVGGISFSSDYGSAGIPMTSVYDIGMVEEGRSYEYQFYVVRAAAKFDLRLINRRSKALNLSAMSISEVADRTWLMPHLDEGAGIWREDGRHDFITADGTVLPWIEWLKYAADESNMSDNITDVTLADRRGWIMEYSLPDGVQSVVKSVGDTRVEAGDTLLLPTVYCAESHGTIMYDSYFAPGLEQRYTMTLHAREDNTSSAPREFALKIPNLRALFRNTHVVVTVEFGERKTWIYARIVEWQAFDPKEIEIKYQ